MRRSPDSIAALTSGGLDSAVLLGELARKYPRVIPLYVKNGLFWEKTELFWLRRYLRALRKTAGVEASLEDLSVIELPMRDLYKGHWSLTGVNVPDYDSEDPSVYLPGRNLILLTKATLYCAMRGISSLALGPLKGNPFPDASHRFFRAFEKTALLAFDMNIRIHTPFLRLSKAEVIARGRGLPLKLTFSCIRPAGRLHCGRCNKCAERQRSFLEAAIRDETAYRAGPKRRRGIPAPA